MSHYKLATMTKSSLLIAHFSLLLLNLLPMYTMSFSSSSFSPSLPNNAFVENMHHYNNNSPKTLSVSKSREGMKNLFMSSTDANFSSKSLFSFRPSKTKRCEGCEINGNLHSARDWLHNVKSLPQSSVLREIRNPVVSIATWSTLVSVVHRLLRSRGMKMAEHMCVSGSPHSLLVSALGLLLVFRTNSAYQRFSEGRAIWERILSTSRNLNRFMSLYEDDIGVDRKSRIQHILASFPYLLRHHIRPKCLNAGTNSNDSQSQFGLLLHEPPLAEIQTRHEGDNIFERSDKASQNHKQSKKCWVDRRNLPWSLLPNESLDKISIVKNRPLWACDRMSKEIVEIPYTDNYTSRERLSLLNTIEKLSNAIGECERIHQTAVPLNYARHSLRSLTFWLFSLPFALTKDLGLLTGPVTGAIAWVLFGVYQIGYSIEDPFQGTIRLSILCDVIRLDILGDEDENTAFALPKTTPSGTNTEEDAEIIRRTIGEERQGLNGHCGVNVKDFTESTTHREIQFVSSKNGTDSPMLETLSP